MTGRWESNPRKFSLDPNSPSTQLHAPTDETISMVWVGLGCLMTPGLSKDILCHVRYMCDYTFLNMQIIRSDIRPHIKWAVSLVIAYGHFNFPQGLWVHMYGLTYMYFIIPDHNTDGIPHFALIKILLQQLISNKAFTMHRNVKVFWWQQYAHFSHCCVEKLLFEKQGCKILVTLNDCFWVLNT